MFFVIVLFSACDLSKNSNVKEEVKEDRPTNDSSNETRDATDKGDNSSVSDVLFHQDTISYGITDIDKYQLDLYLMYMQTEDMLRTEFGISDNEMIENMQLLINDSAIVVPHIIDKETLETKRMSYKDYKDYVKINPPDTTGN